MTHEELQNQFMLNNLSEGDSVQLTLSNGTIVQGILSTSNVFPETTIGNNIVGSRIGLFLAPLTPMRPFFSENILEIVRTE